MPSSVTVVEHPLIQHKLTLMRRTEASSSTFRTLLKEISHLLAYEVTRDLPLRDVEIETPLTKMMAPMLDGKKLCLVSILRAGNGLLEGIVPIYTAAVDECLNDHSYIVPGLGDAGDRIYGTR